MRRHAPFACLLALIMLALAACSPSASTSTSTATSGRSADGGAAVSSAAEPEGAPPVVLIIDGSGTMKTLDVAPTRIDAAKSAATALIDSLPDGSSVAVVTYGTTTGNAEADKPAGCKDISTIAPLAVLDPTSRDAASAAINGIQPSGYTPIASALTQAADLLPDGEGTILLVSDGEDTCAPPDPCETATDLAADHPGLSISTVGLSTSGAANPQLSCIAAAADGLFVTASDTSALVRRLQAAHQGTATRDSLSTTGRAGVDLGSTIDEISAQVSDFPEWSAAKPYSGSLPGVDGVLVEIVWLDCSYVFDEDKVLRAIIPNAGSTVDGVKPGDQATAVEAVYDEPVEVDQAADGTWVARYWADKAAGNAFSIAYAADPRVTPATKIIKIYLCRCLPPAPSGSGNSSQAGTPVEDWTIGNDSYGPIAYGMTLAEVLAVVPGATVEPANNCTIVSLPTSLPAIYGSDPSVVLDGTVIGIVTAEAALTDKGVKVGDPAWKFEQAYEDRKPEWGYMDYQGTWFLYIGPGPNGGSMVVAFYGSGSKVPNDEPAYAIRVGNSSFGQFGEVCSG